MKRYLIAFIGGIVGVIVDIVVGLIVGAVQDSSFKSPTKAQLAALFALAIIGVAVGAWLGKEVKMESGTAGNGIDKKHDVEVTRLYAILSKIRIRGKNIGTDKIRSVGSSIEINSGDEPAKPPKRNRR